MSSILGSPITSTYFERKITEVEFLNFHGAQESITRNRFRQPIPTRFLSPIDCSKIPTQRTKQKKVRNPVGRGLETEQTVCVDVTLYIKSKSNCMERYSEN
jgi:hypothetical protein